jgi:hypothetical protein
MLLVDYHRFLVDDALADAERVIGRIRQSGRVETVEFVTGFGKIRQQLFELLQRYGLNPSYKIGNAGTIICEVE